MGKGLLKNIFSSGASNLVDSVGNAIDKNVTSKEEKAKVVAEISAIITEYDKHIIDVQKEIVLAEMHGNKLQRSWRPILMYTCTFIIFCTLFLFPLLNIWIDNEDLYKFYTDAKSFDKFWSLMMLGIGAFGIGRSGEKIVKDLNNSLDISFKRKKDR